MPPRKASEDPLPIRPRGALDVVLRPPGSRSLTNRALLAAALAHGESELTHVTPSDDTRAMRDALRKLGVRIECCEMEDDASDGARFEIWRVLGSGGELSAPADGALNVGASGTTARFLAAALALARGAATLDGSARMRERPIAELADALEQLGAPARVLGANGGPPLRLAGGGLPGGRARVDATRSSQFVSALLLAAPCAARDVEIELRGGALVSRPFVEMTLAVMRAFDAAPAWQGARTLAVPARGYRAARYEVAPDAQAAVYGFCAAAICGGRVRVPGLAGDTVQGDLGVLAALEQMGCRVARARGAIEVRGPARAGALRGIDVDGNAWPDAVLALAVAALFADGPSTLRGIAHLRLKESDRVAALAQELTRLGARVRSEDDALHITPGPAPASAVIETYDDHRMAMSFALAGLRLPGVSIRDPACVAKTWPGYFDELERW